MKTTYTIYHVDGTETKGEVNWPKDPGYDRIRNLINPILGAELEHVSVLDKDKPADMFVDEMGRLKPLAFNRRASEIYRNNWMKKHPGTDTAKLNWIAGDAVVFDRIVWY